MMGPRTRYQHSELDFENDPIEAIQEVMDGA